VVGQERFRKWAKKYALAASVRGEIYIATYMQSLVDHAMEVVKKHIADMFNVTIVLDLGPSHTKKLTILIRNNNYSINEQIKRSVAN
jgi:hypothetical protein